MCCGFTYSNLTSGKKTEKTHTTPPQKSSTKNPTKTQHSKRNTDLKSPIPPFNNAYKKIMQKLFEKLVSCTEVAKILCFPQLTAYKRDTASMIYTTANKYPYTRNHSVQPG